MHATSDVVIIGAGIIGLLSARALVMQGVRVTLVDPVIPGHAASWAGGGILSPLHPWRCEPGVSALVRESLREWPALAARLAGDTGIDPEWRKTGLLMLGGETEAAAPWAQREGVPCERLDESTLRARFPSVAPDTETLWLPDIAQVRNPRLLRALAADLERRGVEFRRSRVTALNLHADRFASAQTPEGSIAAGAAVLCAGAWSGALVPAGSVPEVRPVKGQMLLFRGPPDLVGPVILGAEHYLVPRADGRILAGSTVEHAGFDDTPTETARTTLHAAAASLLPALAGVPVEAQWAGLRPWAGRETPLIGPHPSIRGLWIATGHYRNGLVTAPATARLIADRALGHPPSLDPGLYGWA